MASAYSCAASSFGFVPVKTWVKSASAVPVADAHTWKSRTRSPPPRPVTRILSIVRVPPARSIFSQPFVGVPFGVAQ